MFLVSFGWYMFDVVCPPNVASDVNECSRVVNPAFRYAGSWERVPAGLDVVSMDGYCVGNLSDPKCAPAKEAQMMRGMYELWLLPKMASHQRIGVVPGAILL
jgi:hypothetical protein